MIHNVPKLRAGLFVALCLSALMLRAQHDPEQADGEGMPLAAFLAGRLTGNEARPAPDRRLRPADVDTWRARVWQAWQQTGAAGAAWMLPDPAPLDSARTYLWHLPDTLEPAADLPFYWGTKGAARPDGGWPLFLYIHGSGPKDAEWAAGLALGRMFDDAPSLYFIPQIPNEGSYYRWWQRAKQFAWERLLRLSLASGRVDPDRLYLFGISEGGYGSQRLASFYADYLAAAGPMAGGEPLRNAPPENCANIAFSLRTGADDYMFARNQLTHYAGELFDSLQRQAPGQYVHRVELMPGCGHGIDYRPTPPWLRQHVRNPYPRSFVWEDFALDGRRRAGFYNLVVERRPDESPDARTRYDLRIEGNDIHLTARRVDYEVTSRDSVWGIEIGLVKHYTPVAGGRVTVYLNDELVDLNRPVALHVNGRCVFRGKVPLRLRHLLNSCATFYDPRRLYPAAIEAEW